MKSESKHFKGWGQMDIYEKLNTLKRVGTEHDRQIRELYESYTKLRREREHRERTNNGEYRQTAIFS